MPHNPDLETITFEEGKKMMSMNQLFSEDILAITFAETIFRDIPRNLDHLRGALSLDVCHDKMIILPPVANLSLNF